MNEEIYFITLSLRGGGAESVCVNIANELARKGLTVNIVVLNEIKSVYQFEINDNVKYHVLDSNKMRFSFFKLFRWVLREKPKKIVVFNYEMSILMVFVRMFSFVRFAILSRNINNFEKKYSGKGVKGFFIKKLISTFYKRVDYVINQCDMMKKQFDYKFPSLKNRNRVIYNPLNKKFDFDFPELRSFKYNGDSPYFICIGRLNSQKDFTLAINSFSLFLKKKPGYKLIFLGEGELEDKLKKQVRELKIENSVFFKGFTRDLSKYYVNAAAVLLTSRFEGFPNVLVESIAHGVPVISVDCESGPNEIIKEGINGYLVKSRSPIEFSNKMIDLVQSPKLDSYSIYKTSRRFSIDKIVLDWEEVLRS